MSLTSDDELGAIPVDDPIRQGAGKVVEPPVDPQLEFLPTNLMDWEDFERMLLDLGRHELDQHCELSALLLLLRRAGHWVSGER